MFRCARSGEGVAGAAAAAGGWLVGCHQSDVRCADELV